MKTIKFGDSGFEVIKLQEILEIKADGEFGMNTHEAVIAFQKEHNLVADGIVGPVTWGALLAKEDTSLENDSEIEQYMMKEGNWVKDDNGKSVWIPNYYKGPVHKKWFFLHHTAGWESPYTTTDYWANKPNTVATEYVLGGQNISKGNTGHDGKLIQVMPTSSYAWHLTIGNNSLHRDSIGLEICSFGGLTKGGYYKNKIWTPLKAMSYYTYTGHEVSPDQIVDIGWEYRGFQYFHKISDAQLKEIEFLINYLQEKHNIDMKKGLQKMILSKGVQYAFNYCNATEIQTKGGGLYTHGNVYPYKNDIFPQQELVDLILSIK